MKFYEKPLLYHHLASNNNVAKDNVSNDNVAKTNLTVVDYSKENDFDDVSVAVVPEEKIVL